MGRKSGIYCIENSQNGKKYIGQSINIHTRKNRHFSMLEKNTHYNSHLQNAYNKYGRPSFCFKVLIYCESFELTKYEQFFVDFYSPEILYNMKIECVDSSKGLSPSKKTRAKLSKALAGKRNSPETRRKISIAKRGKNHHFYGKKFSEEHKAKLSKAHFGKKFSKKTRDVLSKQKMGEKNSQAKLTNADVFSILDLYYNKKYTQKRISEEFPVTARAISFICIGKRWEYCYKKFKTEFEEQKWEEKQFEIKLQVKN